eukprot:1256425-Prorocentrum_lima.AAC.1
MDFGYKKNQKHFGWKSKTLKVIWKMYFPEDVFQKCQVLRGQIVNLEKSPLLVGEHTAVVAWRKNDNKK